MADFKQGDRVLVNGALVAVVDVYDTDANVLVYTANVGGGTDTTYGHVSNTRLEMLQAAPEAEPAAPAEDPNPNEPVEQ